MHLREAVLKKIFLDTLEMIENDVVSIPVLLWCLEFLCRQKKEETWGKLCLKKLKLADNISAKDHTK